MLKYPRNSTFSMMMVATAAEYLIIVIKNRLFKSMEEM
jgi:hypothetical protein